MSFRDLSDEERQRIRDEVSRWAPLTAEQASFIAVLFESGRAMRRGGGGGQLPRTDFR